MGELVGGLIQMNAHMVMTDWATAITVVGILIAVISGFTLIGIWSSMTRNVRALVISAAIVGVVLAIAGTYEPRVKEIRACASGQVSLEQIATRYKIMSVDGKEIVLREK